MRLTPQEMTRTKVEVAHADADLCLCGELAGELAGMGFVGCTTQYCDFYFSLVQLCYRKK